MKQLNIEEKSNVAYCIPLDLRDQQIKINIKKVKERLIPVDYKATEPIALVGSAPSLNDTWEQLKNFNHIITCSGAHKFLLDKGLKPSDFKSWYHADLDPREHKIKILGEPHHDIQYLIASTIHPKYLDVLNGYNVKLWHIFATDEDAERVLPKGEWKFTGGSSVGLRTFTLARALGFTDLHVFGMDGSMVAGKTHTVEHPNAPPQSSETEYKGKKYLTTNSMLHVAKETFKEMDQMHDCNFTFYGDGLVQDMFKDYVPNKLKATNLAFNSPETISKEYVELNKKLHETNPNYGMGGAKHLETVLKIIQGSSEIKTVGDYGSGKGMLAKELFKQGIVILEYDPAIEGKTELLPPCDLIICSDVLEHIEPDRLNFVLADLKRIVKKVGYFVISTRKAVKTYANGQNAHLIVQGKDWWESKLKKHFNIGTIAEKKEESELHIIVSPKVAPQPEMEIVEKDGLQFKFLTPNDTTKWRAKSLFTKEPSTIEWIDSMKQGDVLFDIGANVGSYSIYAGVKGIKVYSFEPEAENYALLVKNLNLNGIEPHAYCLAVSDKTEAGTLYASGNDVGGACHSFNEKVGFDLLPRETKFTQGCMGMRLDELGLVQPDHIKIDVDGFEYKAIMGALEKLSNCKSLLIEINPSLQQHLEMIDVLKGMGFEYDQSQVDRATRKEGAFKGCAEYIFRKKAKPYPYFVMDNVFSKDVYDAAVQQSRTTEYSTLEKARGTKGYPERFVAPLIDAGLMNHIYEGLDKLINKIAKDFGLDINDYYQDLLFIHDKPGYKIGVHRDRLDKAVTALIYLPTNKEAEFAGTTVYKPKQEGFVCPIGRHYGFDEFDKVETIGYVPNRAFVFLNTDHSFHGVEPCSVERYVLLLTLNKKQ